MQKPRNLHFTLIHAFNVVIEGLVYASEIYMHPKIPRCDQFSLLRNLSKKQKYRMRMQVKSF